MARGIPEAHDLGREVLLGRLAAALRDVGNLNNHFARRAAYRAASFDPAMLDDMDAVDRAVRARRLAAGLIGAGA